VADMVFEADGSPSARTFIGTRPQPRETRLPQRLRRGSRVKARPGESSDAEPRREPPSPGPRRAATRGPASHNGALSLETIEANAVFEGDLLSSLEQDRRNRATQLIEDFMIGPTDDATYLEARDFLPSAGCCGRRSVGTDRAACRSFRRPASAEPDAVALEAFLVRRRQATRGIPDLSCGVSSFGRGYALDLPAGSRPDTSAGGQGLTPTTTARTDGAFPTSARTAPEGGDGGARCPTPSELAELAKHARRGRRRDESTAGPEIGGGAAPVRPARNLRRHRHRRVSERTWVRLFPTPRGRLERGYMVLTSAITSASSWSTRRRTGFIDFACA